MTLCFGVFATILKMAASPSVMQRELVSKLVGTIDPDNSYGEKGFDTAVSRLMNGKANFPKSEASQSTGATRDSYKTTTCVIPKSHQVDLDDLAKRFQTDVFPLLNEDKKAAAVGALQYVIREDDTLKSENRLTLEKCIGMDVTDASSTSTEIRLPRFLAGLFLYTLLTNRNSDKGADVEAVKVPGFFNQFRDHLVTYTNECSQGFTPAPDNCSGYLEKVSSKYSVVSTLIYRGTAHPFYDLYVPGSVVCSEREIDGLGIQKLLSLSKNLIFTGTGGQGKSMLMRHLLLDGVEHYEETGLVPVFISVKDFDGAIPDILQCAHVFMRNLWPELSMDELQTLFIDGKALLLFDGLDEIRPTWLTSFTSALNAFIDRYTDNAIFLSSRPYDNFASFDRFTSLALNPFTKGQAIELVSKLDYPKGKPEINREFRKRLNDTLYDDHRGVADNPLLLSIMLMTYDEYRNVPSKIHRFYQEAYQVLAKLHDSGKGNFARPLATGWTVDQFADYFSFFCADTYRRGDTSFSRDSLSKAFTRLKRHYSIDAVDLSQFISDLCDNICLMFFDGRKYSFIHRSFQEYFCARFLYRQDPKNLENVIPLFDRRNETRRGDRTLEMLYDMEPDTVTNHLFVPYLKKLIEECTGRDGLWTFLERIYSGLECADGEQKGKESSLPDSRLYEFIRDIYGLHSDSPVPEDYPVLDGDDLDIFVFRKDIKQSVNIRRVPEYYMRDYGKPVVTGRLYRFHWERLKGSDDGQLAVENPDGPFACEYEKVKRLYERLSTMAADMDESDPFEDMF